jgi:hypothetical protein
VCVYVYVFVCIYIGCLFQLSPEAIHINSQTMSGVIAFMIQQGTTLFNIPPKLATDIQAYLAERERRKLSPKKEVYKCHTFANIKFFFYVYVNLSSPCHPLTQIST